MIGFLSGECECEFEFEYEYECFLCYYCVAP